MHALLGRVVELAADAAPLGLNRERVATRLLGAQAPHQRCRVRERDHDQQRHEQMGDERLQPGRAGPVQATFGRRRQRAVGGGEADPEGKGQRRRPRRRGEDQRREREQVEGAAPVAGGRDQGQHGGRVQQPGDEPALQRGPQRVGHDRRACPARGGGGEPEVAHGGRVGDQQRDSGQDRPDAGQREQREP